MKDAVLGAAKGLCQLWISHKICSTDALADGTQFDESQKDAGIVWKLFCENNDDRWL